ncbi:hypothetical protein [Hymenobacter psoromatis]|uniref:hypothetical protein n=1 Tax=Hymenobacter psoromatis TaxID=1484116 RepID=UPI001CBCCAB2|nr:hypothetical protein [Hymenobacter psoromatis]
MPSKLAAPQFIIRLINPRKAYWGRIVGGALTAISFLIVLRAMAPYVTRAGAVIGFAAGILAPLILIWMVFQRLTTDLCFVKIAADRLTVFRPKTRQELTVFYDEILTYKDYFFDGNRCLRLRLRDGHYTELKTDITYRQTSEFHAMARAFEAAIGELIRPASLGPTHPAYSISREKTFFENSLAIYLLPVIVGAVSWVSWILHSSDRPLIYWLPLLSMLGFYCYSLYQART